MIMSKKCSFALTGAGLTTLLTLAGVSAPAEAAADTGSVAAYYEEGTGQFRIDVGRDVAVDPRLETILPHVSERDGVAYLDRPAVAATGIDPAYLDEFATGFTRGGGHVVADIEVQAEQSAPHSRKTRSACVGRNRMWTDFWGSHIELDSCVVDSITSNMATGGAGAGAVGVTLAAIPGIGAASGIVAGLLFIGSGVLRNCGFPWGRARGATIHMTSVVWCGSQ